MRIEKLKEQLFKLELSDCIFTNRDNIYYFSGYSGEGMLVFTNDKQYILTDFRYTELAQKESPQSEIVDIGDQTYHGVLKKLFSNVDKIGFEDEEMTVSQLDAIKKECVFSEFIGIGKTGMQIRAVKEEAEISLLQAAADATQDALNQAYKTAAFGMKEVELSAELEYFLKKNYAASTAFDFIVASGENGSMPHAVTGERKFSSGDMVTLDFGAKIDRYNSDMTRTFSMGRPGQKIRDIYEIVKEAQHAAQEALGPGKACRDIDAIARGIIEKHGYGKFFGHGTGHGVGLNIHEEPRLNTKSEAVLEKGMVVTVEPGIYIPGLGGVRIENSCYITEGGYRSFFDASTELNIIDGGEL